MTRNEHDDIETLATAAFVGLLIGGTTPADQVAAKAFDYAEVFQQEKLKRIGEKPPYDM
jgi:hypothetical protein